MQNHEDFLAIKPQLQQKLAEHFEAKLIEMGEDAKGISWFSSVAAEYNVKR